MMEGPVWEHSSISTVNCWVNVLSIASSLKYTHMKSRSVSASTLLGPELPHRVSYSSNGIDWSKAKQNYNTHTSIRDTCTTKVSLNATHRIFCHPGYNLNIEIILDLIYVLYGNSHIMQLTYIDGTWEKSGDECTNVRGGITRGLVKTA
jgi:hypothetical protein